MDEQLAQLQATLREIEQGVRLERLDTVLVQRVLQKPVRVTAAAAQGRPPEECVSGQDAYRALLELRRSKKQQQQQRSAQASVETKNQQVRAREKQLAQSQRQVARATTEMHALLGQSQSLLPSRFLFERHLTELCQERTLEVVKHVLRRFQHRFYQLSFTLWRAATLVRRRIAHECAALTISRAFRGHRGRKLARQVRQQLAERQRQAAKLLAFRVAYRQHQALTIQMVWRRCLRRRAIAARERYRESAAYLQHRFRDRRLRQNRLVHALVHARAHLAAIVVQKHFRGHRTRRQVRAQRRQQAREALVAAVLARHRQRAAQLIARRVCHWFGVNQRRQDARARQLETWLRALAGEQRRARAAALVIQRHLRRWVTQRKFEMENTRRRKRARKQRIADKAACLLRAGGGSSKAKAPVAAAVLSPSKKTVALPTVAIALKGMRLRGSKERSGKSAENDAAATIQRSFRRHTRYVHFLRRHWRDEAVKIERRVLTRRRAATAIQKRVRGRQARRRCRQLKAEKLLRAFILTRKWKSVVRRAQAARRICRWLAQRRTQQLAGVWRLEQRRQHAMAARIQQLWRRRALRSALSALLARARRREETALFCRQSLRVCTQHLTDELVFASLHCGFDEGIRGYMVFLVASGAKDPSKWRDTDERSLLQTTLERSRVVALFKAVNKHHADAKGATSKGSPKAKSRAASAFFSMTDVDLALAKAGGASKRALTFEDFRRVLRLLGELKLAARVQVWWSRFEGSDAQLFALLWDFVFVLPEIAPLVQRLSDCVREELDRRCERLQRLFRRGRNLRQGLLARLERRRQLDAHARSRAATLLQARVRVLLARTQLKRRVQAVYEKYIDPDWGLPYWTNPTSGYSTWAKPRVLRAEDVNTEAVPYPPASLTLKIPCEGNADCAKCAEWFCHDCAEWFCAACLPVFHKNAGDSDSADDKVTESATGASGVAGDKDDDQATTTTGKKNKSDHEMEKITLCGLCQFQVASRKCRSCLSPRLKKNASSLVSAGAAASPDVGAAEREALFCDVCFAYAHRRGELTAHKSVELLEMCHACTAGSDDELDTLPAAHDTSSTDARSKLQPPGVGLAVQWQCESCDSHRRVCGKCVATVHPPELCGAVAQRVPLQTLAMLERTRRLATEADARDRADVAKMRLRALEARRERCAVRLQRFWRARAPVLRAKRVVSRLQQQARARWLQLQADAKREKQLVYLVRSFFGVAKPLATDSAVGRKLREMNALQRRQLAIRARMFGLLVPEYMRVGIPLPGVGRVVGGARAIDTTEDLRGWVKHRQTLRLKRVAVDPTVKRETWSSWRHLSRWDHGDREEETAAGGGEDEELLVDVDAKETITERRLPLAQPLAPASALLGSNEESAAAIAVEPLAPSSDAGFGYDASDLNAVVGAPEPPAEMYPYDSTATYTGYEYGYGYSEYDYNSYYGTGAVNSAYPPDYASLELATPLVDSVGYFSAPDGNAGAWQGYDYDTSAYTASTYYGDTDTGYETGESYPVAEGGGLGGSVYGDATAHYEDTSGTTAWSGYPLSQQDGDAYGIDPMYSNNGDGDGTFDASATADSGYYNYDDTAADSVGAWEEVFDPQSNRTYYVHRVTGESAWDLPVAAPLDSSY
ncbi:hypothetical protein PybrP1_001609 [[Pythium] brassicae (nom. inval.)]|nr:hypothetical protein PybrP1_001609 [[Pythium] brassicae (nom. inval.)]